MRLVITVPWGERLGGAEEMLWSFLTNVDLPCEDVHVIFFGHGEFAREVEARGIRTTIIPSGRLRHPKNVVRVIGSLFRILRHDKPRLVLNWSPKTQVYGGIAALLARMSNRVVWWQHGVPGHHWLDRAATALPARAIGCSSHASANAQASLRPLRPCFVVHPGVSVASTPTETDRDLVRRSLGIPAGTTVLGIVGRLQPWKGQDRFVEMLGLLCARGRPVHGLIVGGDAYGLSPQYAAYVQQLVASRGLDGAVTMTGQVDDATFYMKAMDVLVSASMHEPFGIVLLEAMALEVPPVAAESAGPCEIIEPRKTGLLVDAPSPDRLAAAVDELIVRPDLRRELGRRARERVLKQFTAQQMADALYGHLERVAAAA